MATVVVSVMLPVAVVAILWPGPLARLNAAGIRSLPVAAPKSMRERAASNSTPGSIRFWGVAALVVLPVIATNVIRTVLEDGIEEIAGPVDAWMAWPVYAIGVAQILFGSSLLIWSRRIFDALHAKFAENSADLRRWMVVVLGAVAFGMGATSLFVAVSLS